jgi:hypothetical protein
MTLDEVSQAHQSLIKLQAFFFPTIAHDFREQKTLMFCTSYMQDVLQEARVAATTPVPTTPTPTQ